jgi:hypothetical protein
MRAVATPEIPPVRIWPSAKASMIASSRPVSLFHKLTRGVAPPAVCAQVLVPTMFAPSTTAPIACSV